MNKQYKTKDGFFAGSHSAKIARLNEFIELAENEQVYLTADNEMVVSDVAIKGAALLSDKPDGNYQNVNGQWVEIDAVKSTFNVDDAFMRLIGAYSISGSYTEKQKAMTGAVKSLGENATANELYGEAVNILGGK